MSPRSKREYLEAIFLRYKKTSRKEKRLFWTNSAPPPDITVNMPSGCSGGLNGSQSQKRRNEADLLSMTVTLS